MKKVLSLVLTLSLLVSMCVFTSVSVSAQGEQWNGSAAATFSGGGDGSLGNPYKIDTAAELKLFANIVNGEGGQTQDTDICGILTADIVLNSGAFTVDENNAPLYNSSDATAATVNVWVPIGINIFYDGTFNGAGHTVSGLYFNDSNQNFVGLFGALSFADILNLGVVNSYINGDSRVGGVCGDNTNSTITDCYNSGTVSGSSDTGGVCGFISDGTLTGCYNTGTVIGSSTAGGVCGYNGYGTITGCYNTGAVSGSDQLGGVCGSNSAGTITDCYNGGTVSGSDQVGGVCGSNSAGTITDCYNTGTVSGSFLFVGGVCGSNSAGTITDCYNTGTVDGTDDGDCLGGVCGRISGGMVIGCFNTGAVSGRDQVGGVCGNIGRGEIAGCYNTGTVSGRDNLGGVCGYNSGGTVTACYNIARVNCMGLVGGVCGYSIGTVTGCYYWKGPCTGGIANEDVEGSAEGKNYDDMQTQEFVNTLNENGGDFVFYGGYPAQSWEPNPNPIEPAPVYTVTIPAEVALGQTCPVSVYVTVLPTGKQVEITLTGTSGGGDAFTMQTADGVIITYTVSNSGNPVAMGDRILTANAVGNKSASLVFNSPQTVQFAGTYSGTISFTVSVADAD